jgi:hypothetical protein
MVGREMGGGGQTAVPSRRGRTREGHGMLTLIVVRIGKCAGLIGDVMPITRVLHYPERTAI